MSWLAGSPVLWAYMSLVPSVPARCSTWCLVQKSTRREGCPRWTILTPGAPAWTRFESLRLGSRSRVWCHATELWRRVMTLHEGPTAVFYRS